MCPRFALTSFFLFLYNDKSIGVAFLVFSTITLGSAVQEVRGFVLLVLVSFSSSRLAATVGVERVDSWIRGKVHYSFTHLLITYHSLFFTESLHNTEKQVRDDGCRCH